MLEQWTVVDPLLDHGFESVRTDILFNHALAHALTLSRSQPIVSPSNRRSVRAGVRARFNDLSWGLHNPLGFLRFLKEPNIRNPHLLIDRFTHVVNGQERDGYSG